ncbi:MAG: hypothetical protein ACLFTV_11010, partial [Desulfococcaceae bacterium]
MNHQPVGAPRLPQQNQRVGEGEHRLNFSQDRADQLPAPETGVDDPECFFHGPQVAGTAFVFFDEPQVFVGEGRVAQQRNQHLHVLRRVGPVFAFAGNGHHAHDVLAGFDGHADEG